MSAATAHLAVDVMEQRLQAWAAWLKGGNTGAGYPTKSVLHPSWMPPPPGATPAMRTSPASSDRPQRELDADIRALSLRLQDTLAVVYLWRTKPADQAAQLECQTSTVRARVGEAKRLLSGMADARQRYAG